MTQKYRVEIPSTIILIRKDPSVIEFEGRPVETVRHTLRIKLPSGHTIEATLNRMDYHKVSELVEDYKALPRAAEAPETHKCSACKQVWEGDSKSCPACGYERS